MNLAGLIASIAGFANRTDLDSVIPTFIAFTEARMNRTIRCRRMEYRVTASIGTQFSTLPTDFLEMRNVQVNSDPVTALQYVTPQQADEIRQSLLQGPPQYFSVVANRLELIPVPQEVIEVEMVYYQKIPALTDPNQTNWLLETFPDVYVYGSLVSLATYLKDDPSTWAQLFDSALSEIVVDDQRSQFQGTTPQQRGICIG